MVAAPQEESRRPADPWRSRPPARGHLPAQRTTIEELRAAGSVPGMRPIAKEEVKG